MHGNDSICADVQIACIVSNPSLGDVPVNHGIIGTTIEYHFWPKFHSLIQRNQYFTAQLKYDDINNVVHGKRNTFQSSNKEGDLYGKTTTTTLTYFQR